MPQQVRSGVEGEAPPGLVYVSDAEPGITRRARGRGFSFHDPSGRPIGPGAERERILRLGVPPAYRQVWICPLANGHLQATGLDALGRKQYRYHADWSAWRSATKYEQLAAFGVALPRLRARIRRDLEGSAGDLGFTLAALAMLIDRLNLRVGNASYTETSRTYGATTLLKRHLSLTDGALRLRFRAKGGKRVEHTLRDKRLSRILQEIHDLPGRRLFSYANAEGEIAAVSSAQLNAYLADATGVPGATAKTFRTWGGTLAAFALARSAKGTVTMKALAEAAAERLGNTPAICRGSYIHPRVLKLSALSGEERRDLLAAIRPDGPRRLSAAERHLIGLLGSTDRTALAASV